MNMEFDRYEIERTIKVYSNDLLSAFHSPRIADEAEKRNAIARAQSLLSDWAYLENVVAGLREQIKDAQRASNDAKKILP